MKPKYWTVAILACALVVVSVFYYLRQPGSYYGPYVIPKGGKTKPQTTTQQPEGWQTYTDSKNKIGFEFPNSWKSESIADESFLFGPAEADDNAFAPESISLFISSSSRFSTLEVFAQKQAGQVPDYRTKITLTPTTLDSIPAIKVQSIDQSESDKYVFFYKGEAILLHDVGTSLNGESTEFQHIIATFKFAK